MVPSGLRYDLARIFCPASDCQLELLLIKPGINLPYVAQLRKLGKDQIDGGPDPGIGIFLDAVMRSFDVPKADPSNHMQLFELELCEASG